MPIQRKGTPPTSQLKEQHTVLASLSAWTDTGDPEEDGKTASKAKPLVINPDEPATLKQQLSQLFDPENDTFNIIIGIVILANAIIIGVETEIGRQWCPSFAPNLPLLIVFENMFNAIFFCEMCLRIARLGPSGYFSEGWYIFDCSLVVIGTLDLWILPLFQNEISNVGYHFSVMRLLRVIRVLRMLRVLRVIRLFRMFNQLYLIMQAFWKALGIVALIGVLVVILDYVCAIILTQGVGHKAADYGEYADLVDAWFGTLASSMQTLFFIMTLTIPKDPNPQNGEHPKDVTTVLEDQIPGWVVGLGMILYIMVTSYTMVSLITGIISESLITSQQEYKRRKMISMEDKKKVVAFDLHTSLNELLEDEKDDHGDVDHEELKMSVRGDTELYKKLAECGILVEEKHILGLIDSLSGDGATRVNIAYFVDKLTNLTGEGSASAIADLKYEVSKTKLQLDALAKKMLPGVKNILPVTEDVGPKLSEQEAQKRRSKLEDSKPQSAEKKVKKYGMSATVSIQPDSS